MGHEQGYGYFFERDAVVPVVTKDATSGKWIPQSSSEYTSLLSGTGIGNPSLLWLCQELASSLADSIGSFTGTASGSPTYQNAVSGWSQKAVGTRAGQADMFATGSWSDVSSFAVAWLSYPTTNAVATSTSIMTFGGTFGAQVAVDRQPSLTKIDAVSTGDAHTNGTTPPAGAGVSTQGVHLTMLQADKTAAAVTVQTDLETLSHSTTAANSWGTFALGGNNVQYWTAAGIGAMHVAAWASFEPTSTQRATIADRYNNGPAITSIAISPASATLAPSATQTLVATSTRADTSTIVNTATVTWTTSNAAVATVNSSGVVTAVAGGTATITASFTSLNATPASNTCAITVSAGGSVYVPIPVIGTDVPDHVASALGRLFEQDKGKPTIVALVTAYVTPIQALESALWQLLTQRQVDTAIGAQLDALGKLVNQPRNGSIDTDYSRYIRARISTNNSKGRFEDLITIARLVLNDTTLQIVISQEGAATIRMRIVGVITDSTAAILVSFMAAAVAAGIRLVVQWSVVATAAAFRFDVGPGWDVGKLAAAIG